MKKVIKIARRVLIRNELALTAACVLVAGLLARPVAAQYEPPSDAPSGGIGAPLEEARRVALGMSISHDSNLFRDPGVLRDAESETITNAFAKLLIDKPYAQQRFVLDATASTYRYKNFSYLDFDGVDYRAAWYWRLTPRLRGTLSAARTETPTQFQDTVSRQSDVTTSKNYAFNMDGELFGGWHAILGASYNTQTSEQALLQGQPDYRETRGEAGIRYLFRSGSSIDVLGRRIEGDQDSQVINNVIVLSSNNYQEDQAEIRATWILTAKSSVTGRVTYLDRHYEQFPEDDFDGVAGELSYSWLPAAKLSVRLAATRSIVPWQSLTSNYRVSNTLLFAPTWQASAKTNVYLSFQRTLDDFPASSPAVPDRNDTTDIAALGLNWFAARSLIVGASVQYQQRASDIPLAEYDATVARLSASLLF